MNAHNLPAAAFKPADAIAEYEAKVHGGKIERMAPNGVIEVVAEYPGLKALIQDYVDMHRRLDIETSVAGAYAGPVVNYHASLYEESLRQRLLKSAWRCIFEKLNVKDSASAADLSRLELMLENPPELTKEAVREHLSEYVLFPRFHKLKGLAEAFVGLDPAYKSHSKVKVGVNGLPKRIILNNVAGDYGSRGYGSKELENVINAINVVQGDPRIPYGEFDDLLKAAKITKTAYKGLELKIFQNGNAHLFFSPHKLQQVNDALHEFYGDVLPDAEEENAKKRPSTQVAKDLQFYPTPKKVIESILTRHIHLLNDGEGQKFLEPQCGDGRIMDVVRAKYPKLSCVGVEIHGGRVQETRDKGHKVLQANFLQVKPNPIYDLILMNPPFYGLHWQKHLTHAIQFLNRTAHEGRRGYSYLICILPATAFYDGHLGEMGLIPKDAHTRDHGWRDTGWNDLPVASFAESGTNVPTGYLVYGAQQQ